MFVASIFGVATLFFSSIGPGNPPADLSPMGPPIVQLGPPAPTELVGVVSGAGQAPGVDTSTVESFPEAAVGTAAALTPQAPPPPPVGPAQTEPTPAGPPPAQPTPAQPPVPPPAPPPARTPVPNQSTTNPTSPVPAAVGTTNPGPAAAAAKPTQPQAKFVPETPAALRAPIYQASLKYGIPTDVLSAALSRESAGFDSKYVYGYHVDGTGRGVAGIDKGFHPEVSDAQAFDPAFAIPLEAEQLAKLARKNNGDLYSALREYNGGPNFASTAPGYAGRSIADLTKAHADAIMANAARAVPQPVR